MSKASQTALITGASRGIGRGIALGLAREGFNIVINYASNVAAADEARRQVEALGARALTIQADVGSSADQTPGGGSLGRLRSHRSAGE